MKTHIETLTVRTDAKQHLVNLTERLNAAIESAGIRNGFAGLFTQHTTAVLLVNEWQSALLEDIGAFLGRVVEDGLPYKHNSPEFSDCDRRNADSHLRNVVVGQSLSVPISNGKLVLGQWQSVILAEFDGPNQRTVFFQVFGI